MYEIKDENLSAAVQAVPGLGAGPVATAGGGLQHLRPERDGHRAVVLTLFEGARRGAYESTTYGGLK